MATENVYAIVSLKRMHKCASRRRRPVHSRMPVAVYKVCLDEEKCTVAHPRHTCKDKEWTILSLRPNRETCSINANSLLSSHIYSHVVLRSLPWDHSLVG